MNGKLRQYKVCLQQNGSLCRSIPENGFATFQVVFRQSDKQVRLLKISRLGNLHTKQTKDPTTLIHTSVFYRLLDMAYPEWLAKDHEKYHTNAVLHLPNAGWGIGIKTVQGYVVPARMFDRTAPAAKTLLLKKYPSDHAFKTAAQAYRCGQLLGWEWTSTIHQRVVRQSVLKGVPQCCAT